MTPQQPTRRSPLLHDAIIKIDATLNDGLRRWSPNTGSS